MDLNSRIQAHRSGAIQKGAPTRLQPNESGKAAGTGNGPAFRDVLKSKVEELKFSGHAVSRLKSRNISMSPEIMSKLENAVSGAAGKGARDSLILIRDLAFIVNIPNKTVITAMDGESIRDNVFTNIDSTVIAG
ncbi:putative flagellar hook associated protein [Chitinispirillum alkaliphilum]|nr:putative flagellar hook associated protein [Chitinispirillum alkaliphilum]